MQSIKQDKIGISLLTTLIKDCKTGKSLSKSTKCLCLFQMESNIHHIQHFKNCTYKCSYLQILEIIDAVYASSSNLSNMQKVINGWNYYSAEHKFSYACKYTILVYLYSNGMIYNVYLTLCMILSEEASFGDMCHVFIQTGDLKILFS